MKIKKAYKTELKLNNKQKSVVNMFFGGARFAYNWGLKKRIELYEKEKKYINAIQLHRELNALKQTEFPWMYEYSKCVMQEALRDLDQSFKNFFRRVKQKSGKVGFPKFKSRKNPKQSFRLTGSIHIVDGKIQLPRLGKLNLKENNYIPMNSKILSATVSKRAEHYFVSVLVEEEIPDKINMSNSVVGVDVGIKTLAITSDNTVYENPKAYKKYLKKLKREQRSLSRKQRGSKNYEKKRQTVASIHYKISNVRKDSIHKMTTSVVKTNPQKIVIEDLKVSNMVKNHNLAQALSDSSFGEIKRQFEYKSFWNGIELVKANSFFPSSKTCSKCGNIKTELKLSERVYRCEVCGFELDRDLNAAINLKNSTESSSGIYACGEDKFMSKDRWSSAKQEQIRNEAIEKTLAKIL